MNAERDIPPQHGTVWLDGNEIWFSFPAYKIAFKGNSYELSGGAISFERGVSGRADLLRVLFKQQALWAPGNEEQLIEVLGVSKSSGSAG